jgi:lipopolysaccharide/colanic/teichoic acid biosynthesis glycosyltransferase
VAKFCALNNLRGTLATKDTCSNNRRIYKNLGRGVDWILLLIVMVVMFIVMIVIVMVVVLKESTPFLAFAIAKVK